MPLTVIVDYGSGNLHSALKALERAAREAGVSTTCRLTSSPEEVRRADRVVLPGVGAFATCRDGLLAVDGMAEALEQRVRGDGVPFLGICVGMQLMADRGLEHGDHKGLGWIAGTVSEVAPRDSALKVPHMGWNTLDLVQDHPLFDGIETGRDGLHAYFVHSYQFVVAEPSDMIATTDYGGPVTAFVAKDNLAGAQFHPEKSQDLGLRLIANFLAWRP